MTIRTNVKAGMLASNHNETLVHKGLKVRTSVKAGMLASNHNETLVR